MTGSARRRLPKPSDRAQSETIGLVLVFGLVIAGATVVVVLGGAALEDSESTLSSQRAEKSMTQLDSKAALVALGTTDVQSVSLPRRGSDQLRVVNGTGWMNVTVKNTTDSSNDFDLVNQSLGSIVYSNGPHSVAYQGGGVWRSRGNGSAMVSPPEFHFRNGTLTLPIVNVTGDASLGSGAAITQEETIKKFPDSSLSDGDNPLDQHKVLLVVRSDYYEAWGDYFEERTDGVVEYDHDKNKTILTLKTPVGSRTVSNAIAATSSSGSLTMSGAGVAPARTDSYNSSVGSYAATGGSDGNITIAGNVDISGNSQVHGDIRSGGWVVCTGASVVDGRIHYTDTGGTNINCIPTDGDEQISGIDGVSPINSHVVDTVSDLQADNDNADPTADVDTATNTLDFSGGSATLPAGEYYLRDLTLTDQTLELQTNGDVIKIGVRDHVDVERASEIDIQGNGRVLIYVRGDATDADGFHFDMQNQGSSVPVVTTPGATENSTQLWIYGQDDFQAQIDGSGLGHRPEFQGVIYAPGGTGGTSSVSVTGQVFGGLLTGDVEIDTGGEVHYDEALQSERAIPRNTRIVKITYMHVTVNRIHVSGS